MEPDEPCVQTRGSISLTVRCDRTKWGDLVAVVGEGLALGNWSVDVSSSESGPLPMLCSGIAEGTDIAHSTSNVVWPQWKLAKPLEVALGEKIEYKYIIIRSNGKHTWETGENRQLVIDEALLQTGLHDDSDFGCISGGLPNERLIGRSSPKDEVQASLALTDRRTSSIACAQHERPIPPYRRLQRIGKGKQGRCYLIEFEESEAMCSVAVLKEFKGGGRHAFQAEVWALSQLSRIDHHHLSAPRLLGADKSHREVLISYFNGACLPDTPKYAAVLKTGLFLKRALLAWTQIVDALEMAHRLGVIHCDVNPWNVLVHDASSDEDSGPSSSVTACLIDWACAQPPSEPTKANGHGKHRRGEFQPLEFCRDIVGERTDVYGSAATLLWILVRRTRKGLGDTSKEALSAYFVAEIDQGAREIGWKCGLSVPAVCEELAAICSWGLEEDYASRCPSLRLLRENVIALLARFDISC